MTAPGCIGPGGRGVSMEGPDSRDGAADAAATLSDAAAAFGARDRAAPPEALVPVDPEAGASAV
ncbi:MAG: hypothetical protein OXI15_00815, partial [Chromatiales bacterium]|nr:hypothetical protein [Chromatiales bacterium]